MTVRIASRFALVGAAACLAACPAPTENVDGASSPADALSAAITSR